MFLPLSVEDCGYCVDLSVDVSVILTDEPKGHTTWIMAADKGDEVGKENLNLISISYMEFFSIFLK